MKYNIKNENTALTIIERLLQARNIDDNIDSFLNPSIKEYWINPFFLNDMKKAVNRIITAIEQQEKIMIFGDYDVDGITSSYILYDYISNQIGYKNISIQFPDRIKDGYGLKNKHIDMMKEKNINLIITVDNGITSIEEAEYAKELNIDLVITDHHKNLETIPDAFAVVNPQVSPDYPFKGLAGVGVAFKLINALMIKLNFDNKRKGELFNYYLPIVAIGTVADIVPLVQENRAIVKRGLELINNSKHLIPTSLQGMIKHLNLNNVDTFHIGFMIGPRINAGGRIASPYKSLHTLLHQGEKQKQALEELEEINTQRRKMQEEMFKNAEKQVVHEENILFAESEDFHEGIVGIISGRITEKYNKPSAIFKINNEEGIAVASLRAPSYFNIVDMLKAHNTLLERFGGHKQAGGLTVKLENLNTLQEKLTQYCKECINDELLEKVTEIDTELLEEDIQSDILQNIEKLAPFGEANPEPVFLVNDINITKVNKVGQKGKGHLKIEGIKGVTPIQCMFWGKGDELEQRKEKQNNQETVNIIGKIQQDTYRGGQFINGIHYF